MGCRPRLDALLDYEPGGRPGVVSRDPHQVAAEPQLVVPVAPAVEEEAGRVAEAVELAVVLRDLAEAVTGAVHTQGAIADKPIRVGQHHARHREGGERELVVAQRGAHAKIRLARVVRAELAGDHEDVPLERPAVLLRGDVVHRVAGVLGGLQLQIRDRPKLVEQILHIAALAQRRKHAVQRLTVGVAQRLPLRDGKPPLGALREHLARVRQPGNAQLGEVLAQDVELILDGLGLLVRVRVAHLGWNHRTAVIPTLVRLPGNVQPKSEPAQLSRVLHSASKAKSGGPRGPKIKERGVSLP